MFANAQEIQRAGFELRHLWSHENTLWCGCGSAHNQKLSRSFKVTGQTSEPWLRMFSRSQKWCVWSLIGCLKNTTRWTPTLPDTISQGWKIITSANYVIIWQHHHESYVARVIKQECPRARWVRLLIGWSFSLSWDIRLPKVVNFDLCLLIKKKKKKKLQKLLVNFSPLATLYI